MYIRVLELNVLVTGYYVVVDDDISSIRSNQLSSSHQYASGYVKHC